MSGADFPSWLPASAGHVEEKVAQATLRKLQRCQVHLPLLQRSLQTVYIETAVASAAAADKSRCSLAALKFQTAVSCAYLHALTTAICNLITQGTCIPVQLRTAHQGHDPAQHHCRAEASCTTGIAVCSQCRI